MNRAAQALGRLARGVPKNYEAQGENRRKLIMHHYEVELKKASTQAETERAEARARNESISRLEAMTAYLHRGKFPVRSFDLFVSWRIRPEDLDLFRSLYHEAFDAPLPDRLVKEATHELGTFGEIRFDFGPKNAPVKVEVFESRDRHWLLIGVRETNRPPAWFRTRAEAEAYAARRTKELEVA